MLSVAGEHLTALNPQARLTMFGQELNDDSWKNDQPPSDCPFLACPPVRPGWKGEHPSDTTSFFSERLVGNLLCTLLVRKMSGEALWRG